MPVNADENSGLESIKALESRVDGQLLEMLFMLVWIDGIMKKRKSFMEESVVVDVSGWSH